MGYIRHETIIVTDDAARIGKHHDKAKELGCLVSEIVHGVANGTSSFFIAPDGSKEGWDTSNEHQSKRNNFVAYLKGRDWGPDFVQVSFGGDDKELVRVEDHSGKELL